MSNTDEVVRRPRPQLYTAAELGKICFTPVKPAAEFERWAAAMGLKPHGAINDPDGRGVVSAWQLAIVRATRTRQTRRAYYLRQRERRLAARAAAAKGGRNGR